MSTPLPPPPPASPAGFYPVPADSGNILWPSEDFSSPPPKRSKMDPNLTHFSDQEPSPKARTTTSSGGGDCGGIVNSANGVVNGGGIGRMFYKTKLCCKFRNGTCPYSSNCNFAHGLEELRKPPPNWQEILAAVSTTSPLVNSVKDETGWDRGNNNRVKICKKYFNGEECPYGERCTFVHEDPLRPRERESVAINVGLMGNVSSGDLGDVMIQGQKSAYWKTRICNKWEMTGSCVFGDKCHFAHGLAELQKYGGHPDADNNINNSSPVTTKLPKAPEIVTPEVEVAKGFQKWKSLTKINRIYGDWLDDGDL